ncbi:hypothetical protein NQK81_13230 [Amycolatopsis roodepoortensis]|uniref:hypothetical protein n=1 Tax=Amycolatopsis roodepoortensis TaxID=700274 RepID=UPI00214CA632|nr:hypothetical protein [Amycolatopsis roodepoortensis]UUV34367.1 hypothetical protein NQK81_13230 [Amycolatopsis roodepoortensis]
MATEEEQRAARAPALCSMTERALGNILDARRGSPHVQDVRDELHRRALLDELDRRRPPADEYRGGTRPWRILRGARSGHLTANYTSRERRDEMAQHFANCDGEAVFTERMVDGQWWMDGSVPPILPRNSGPGHL